MFIRLPRHQVLAAVLLGVVGGLHIFLPYFKKIGQEQRQASADYYEVVAQEEKTTPSNSSNSS